MSEYEAERLRMLETYHSAVKDLDSRFGPGSVGWHELWDRLHVQHEVFEDHIATHPSIVLDAETFDLSRQISALMSRLYLHVGEVGWAEDCTDAEQRPVPNTDRH